MKIQNDGANAPLPVSVDASAKTGREERTADGHSPVGSSAGSDLAETSPIARRLSADPARLERLREAVRNGTYSIPESEISSALINEHLADVNKRS